MPKPETEFDGTEGDVLIALYEWPDVTFSSHTLTQRLKPNFQITAPEYRTTVAHVSRVIADHIGREHIQGKRSRNADGVFFNNLKLTSKGVRAAIVERQQRRSGVNVELVMDIVEAIRQQDWSDKG